MRQARRLRARQRRFWFVLMPTVAVLLAFVVGLGALIPRQHATGTPDQATGAGRRTCPVRRCCSGTAAAPTGASIS